MEDEIRIGTFCTTWGELLKDYPTLASVVCVGNTRNIFGYNHEHVMLFSTQSLTHVRDRTEFYIAGIIDCPGCGSTNAALRHDACGGTYQMVCENCGMSGPAKPSPVDATRRWVALSYSISAGMANVLAGYRAEYRRLRPNNKSARDAADWVMSSYPDTVRSVVAYLLDSIG